MRTWHKIVAGTMLAGATVTGGTIVADNAVNPYKDKGETFELEIKSDLPQKERVSISKTEAAVTFHGWNDEYAITISPLLPTDSLFGGSEIVDTPSRPLLSRRMEFKKGDVTAFIEPTPGTSDKVEVDFILDSKPATNIFTYTVEGADDFNFLYQPPLWEQYGYDGPQPFCTDTVCELPEGIGDPGLLERPENVVGSYALYHKTKTNHVRGETNYGVGKCCHIYRPKAIDANGNEVWATLVYADNLLSVTVPQEFLDSASYPVTVDPTFGYTSAGGSTASNQGLDFTISPNLNNTASDSGDVVEIQAYIRNTAATVLAKGFMTDNGGATYTKLSNGVSQPTTVPPDAAGAWQGFYFTPSPTVTSASDYRAWIIFNTNSYVLYNDASGANASQFETDNNGYASPSDPASVSNTTNVYSIYATYAAPTPDCTGNICTTSYPWPGSFTWTAPTNVTKAVVACWGAGGGGGIAASNGGGGGGGGAFASSTVTVVPGNPYTVSVGFPGLADVAAGGDDSTFNSTSVVAEGGSGSSNQTGAAGGTVAASIGMVRFAGGSGGTALTTNDTGGGGGGAAGPHGAGGTGAAGQTATGGGGGGGNGGSNGSAGTGGASTDGGAGGDGGTSGATATRGGASVNGAGGSGGGRLTSATGGFPANGVGAGGGGGSSARAGMGGPGQCTISYDTTEYEQVILTSNPGTGNQTWNVPDDWTDVNFIECIGSGGTGREAGVSSGGGGGAYAKIADIDLTPGGSVTYAIGATATTSTNSAAVGKPRETYFNGSASSTASLSCSYGKQSTNTTGGVGGSSAASTGTTKYSGGNGGSGTSDSGGGGGGGSAGPFGNGANGGNGNTSGGGGGGGGSNGGSSTAGSNGASSGGNGGQGNNGVGRGTGGIDGGAVCTSATAGLGGGGGGSQVGNSTVCNGAIDMSFDATHGAGGGGGGGATGGSSSGVGGTYGGGGTGASASGAVGAGGQGIIVITYVPSSNPPSPSGGIPDFFLKAKSFLKGLLYIK